MRLAGHTRVLPKPSAFYPWDKMDARARAAVPYGYRPLLEGEGPEEGRGDLFFSLDGLRWVDVDERIAQNFRDRLFSFFFYQLFTIRRVSENEAE